MAGIVEGDRIFDGLQDGRFYFWINWRYVWKKTVKLSKIHILGEWDHTVASLALDFFFYERIGFRWCLKRIVENSTGYPNLYLLCPNEQVEKTICEKYGVQLFLSRRIWYLITLCVIAKRHMDQKKAIYGVSKQNFQVLWKFIDYFRTITWKNVSSSYSERA